MTTTTAEYAKSQKISLGTARRRLEKMVAEGQASRKVTWENNTRTRTSRDMPAHKVIQYTMIGG